MCYFHYFIIFSTILSTTQLSVLFWCSKLLDNFGEYRNKTLFGFEFREINKSINSSLFDNGTDELDWSAVVSIQLEQCKS